MENANNLVECHFESRLRFEPVGSIVELNDAVERWCAAYNANLIDGLDTRLKRAGTVIGSRAMLWQKITGEKLRELPDGQTCRQVFANGIQKRRVAGGLGVSLVHPKAGRSLRYSLRDLQGILVGMEVSLQPVLVTEEPLCIVSYESGGEERSFEIAPVQYAGFDISSPVFGEEYKRPKDTAREKRAKAVETGGSGVSAMGPSHSFIEPQSPFIRQRTGTRIEIAETVHTHDIVISATETAKRVKARLGYVPDGFINRMKAEHPEGVQANLVDDLVIEYRGMEEESGAAYKLA